MKPSHNTAAARLLTATYASLLTGCALAAAGHVHGAATAQDLPDGPEKALVQKYCTACHEIARVQRAGGTEAGWQDRIGRMQRWGSKIPPDQVAGVARYLAAALPPRARASDSLTYFANLAVQEVREEDIQVTLRFAARSVTPDRLALTGLSAAEAGLLIKGQRVRVFTPDSRGSATPGMIEKVGIGGSHDALLRTIRPMDTKGKLALAEVTLNLGRHLAVANDAILAEGNDAHVLVAADAGGYEVRQVKLGLAGDLATEVADGLRPGDKVVTLGTFFVDAERRLGGSN